MKTLFHRSIFVLLLIGTQLFFGCEKNPKVVPPVVLQPTVELTITPTGTLKYGDNCIISWTSTNANGGVLLNNQSVGTTGTMTKKLFRDTTFILRGVNGSLTATNQKDVKVGDWTTSKTGLLTHSPWTMKGHRYIQNGIVVSETVLSEDQKTNLYNFYLDGKTKAFHSNGVQFGSGTWSFVANETKILMEGYEYPYNLNLNELIITIEVTWGGKLTISETTYGHQ